jgi:hypothetical protein
MLVTVGGTTSIGAATADAERLGMALSTDTSRMSTAVIAIRIGIAVTSNRFFIYRPPSGAGAPEVKDSSMLNQR